MADRLRDTMEDEYKCISEGLMHVVAWYRGTPGPKVDKFGE